MDNHMKKSNPKSPTSPTKKGREREAWAVLDTISDVLTVQIGYEKMVGEPLKGYWYYYETFPTKELATKRKNLIDREYRKNYKVIPVTISYQLPHSK